MTRDEIIKNMKASEEMDEEILVNVFKWERLPSPAMPQFQRPSENGVECIYFVNHYSRSMGAAWDVAEEMMKNGICRISNGDGDSCDVDFWPYGSLNGGNWKQVNVTEETFPLAICRAALLATI